MLALVRHHARARVVSRSAHQGSWIARGRRPSPKAHASSAWWWQPRLRGALLRAL